MGIVPAANLHSYRTADGRAFLPGSSRPRSAREKADPKVRFGSKGGQGPRPLGMSAGDFDLAAMVRKSCPYAASE